MTKEIKVVTVIGAGAMGGGIAAQLANAGIHVNLLNTGWGGKTGVEHAQARVDEMKKAKLTSDPINACFMDPSNARFINVGSEEEDLAAAVAGSDWVIEVVQEDLERKQALFAEIEKHRRPDTIVTSNTSTMPLSSLTEGRSNAFKENFAITHFFNPPHIMRLLEIVRGDATTDETANSLRDFCDEKLGKEVRFCNDTPAMMANRIGVYLLFRAAAEAFDKGMNIEDVDAAIGKNLGFPKDGIFGLLDLVGIGLVPNLSKSLLSSLPEKDAFRDIKGGDDVLNIANNLLKEGRWGRRSGKGGFYNVQKQADGKRIKLALDLKSGEYRASETPNTSYLTKITKRSGARGFFDLAETISADTLANDPKRDAKLDAKRLSEFAWPVMRDTLLYAVSLIPSVTDNIDDIDQSMRAGYNWKRGPFQILDDLGHNWFIKRLEDDGIEVPMLLKMAQDKPFYQAIDGKMNHMTFEYGGLNYEPNFQAEGVINLQDVKRTSKPLVTHNSASLWDIGDGVACLELHSKMNSMDPSSLYVINESIKLIKESGGQYTSMVIYQGDDRFRSEGGEFARDDDNFSFGANLNLIDTKFELAKHKFSMYNDMATIQTLKKLKVPEKAAQALHQKLKPICEKLDGLQREKRLKDFYNEVTDLIYYGQAVYKALHEAPFPVVGAAAGMAFGGGCELLMHCNAVQAHALFIPGLVEAGVGFIPAWGGTTRTLANAQQAQKAGHLPKGPFVTSKTAFEVISMPHLSMAFTAEEAKKKMWLKADDGITMNRARLLSDAKARAKSMETGFEAPKPVNFFLPGASAATAFRSGVDDLDTRGMLTHHDVVVADALGEVTSGGDTNPSKGLTESELLQKEREAFLSLLYTEGTVARVKHMLKTGKPLREKPLEQPMTTKELREQRPNISLPWREVTGLPLTGSDAKSLQKQAESARKFYNQARSLGLL